MKDYEELILARQDSDYDECCDCEYRKECRSQCEEIVCGRPLEEVYPQLFKM